MIGRTALFIPASSPGMLSAAVTVEADSLIFDLEDAVSIGEKDAARDLLARALPLFKRKSGILVRINPLFTPYGREDIDMVLAMKINSIVLPKATPGDVAELALLLGDQRPDITIIPLIETARSVEEISDIIRSSPRVIAIIFGAEDYSLSLGVQRTKENNEIFYARTRLANAASAFGIEALDTPFTDVDDPEGLKIDAQQAKALGYTGKAAINPRQIEVLNAVFAPKKAEIDQAVRIINAMEKALQQGKGVFQLDGKMIDAPIVERAKKLIEQVKSRGDICC
jgi:citrate lyase subunit beta / citryl-CoA lyase